MNTSRVNPRFSIAIKGGMCTVIAIFVYWSNASTIHSYLLQGLVPFHSTSTLSQPQTRAQISHNIRSTNTQLTFTSLSFHPENTTRQLSRNALMQWAMTHPVDAANYAMKHRLFEQMTQIFIIAGEIKHEPTQHWLTNHVQNRFYSYWLNGYLQGLTQADPLLAVAYALSLSNSLPNAPASSQQVHLETVIHHWAMRDAEAALIWLEDHQLRLSDRSFPLSSQFMNTLIKETLHQLAIQNPYLAYNKLPTLNPIHRPQLLGEIANTLAQTDAYAALNWVDALTESHKHIALTRLLPSIAESDHPEPALSYVLQPNTLTARSNTTTATLINLANNAPDLLQDNLHRLPPLMQRDAIAHLGRSFANKGISAYQNWLASLPEEHDRDTALVTGLEAISFTHPYEAFLLAETLQDLDFRTYYVKQSVGRLATENYDEAYFAIMATSALTEEEKTRFLDNL